jgi:hypothetical protein
VNHEAFCFGFEMEQPPMERSDLDTATGGLFNLRDEAVANQALELRGTQPEVEANSDQAGKDHYPGRG